MFHEASELNIIIPFVRFLRILYIVGGGSGDGWFEATVVGWLWFWVVVGFVVAVVKDGGRVVTV
jgi:hypothetical protein